MSYVGMLLEHTRNYESPTSFWIWSGYITLAAILRDNVWSSDGDDKLFPNIYVLFLAGSGARKNRPVIFSESLVSRINNTKTISGRASIQGVIDELARSETDPETGKPKKGGAAIFYAPELAAGIVEDPAAISIMTDIYDGRTNFQNILRHSPKFKVDRIVFSAFLATNEAMSKGFWDSRAVHGGLLARTLLVNPDEFRPGNSLWTTETEEDRIKKSRERLIAYLHQVAKLQGRFEFTKDAREMYDKWYIPFRANYHKKGDSSGIAGRMHTTIKKLSMILAADKLNMTVTVIEMQKAIDLCMSLMPNYNQFIMSSGKSTIAEAAVTIIKTALHNKNYTITKRDILNIYFQDIDSELFDKTITTLTEGGLMDVIQIGNTIAYRLTKKTIKQMKGDENAAAPE